MSEDRTRESGSTILLDGKELKTACGHSFATCHTGHCFKDDGTKAVIVFRGTPDVWYLKSPDDSRGHNRECLDSARTHAIENAESSGENWSYMVVPVQSLQNAMTMVPSGVTAHKMLDVLQQDEAGS